jgi:hypothetical protein
MGLKKQENVFSCRLASIKVIISPKSRPTILPGSKTAALLINPITKISKNAILKMGVLK